MIDQNGYDYDTFLSDSSDDYPQYADGLSQEQLKGINELGFEVKEIDDEMLMGDSYDQPFHAKPPSNLIALENVLSLAEEQCEFLYSNISQETGLSADQVIADDSILAVKAMLNLMKAGADLKSVEASNIALAQGDKLHEGRA
jgi:hypothetical protein